MKYLTLSSEQAGALFNWNNADHRNDKLLNEAGLNIKTIQSLKLREAKTFVQFVLWNKDKFEVMDINYRHLLGGVA